MDASSYVYLTVVILVLIALGIFIKVVFKQDKKNLNGQSGRNTNQTATSLDAQQQDDIFNISSRVQGHDRHWPTHDAYLSIEHINVSNQLNKPNYGDAPPSYEEAMRIAQLHSSGCSTTPAPVLTTPTVASEPTVVVVPKTTN